MGGRIDYENLTLLETIAILETLKFLAESDEPTVKRRATAGLHYFLDKLLQS
jgi:hypothetical protein